MRKQIAAACVLMGFALPCVAASGVAHRVTNAEFKFSVSFRGVDKVCDATSGTHPHGFFVLLSSAPTDCENSTSDTSISAIGVSAGYNSTFEESPEDVIDGFCQNSSHQDESVSKEFDKSVAFAGRHSASCKISRADGTIDIYVVTQAGKWPKEHGDPDDAPDLNTPFVNYWATLHTTEKSVVSDLSEFRAVLSGFRIGYRK